MKQMPKEIKQKLREYAKIQIQAKQVAKELGDMFEEYGVPEDNLIGMGNAYSDEPQTEALAFFHNGECDDMEQSIRDIEEVFLWFVNNKN